MRRCSATRHIHRDGNSRASALDSAPAHDLTAVNPCEHCHPDIQDAETRLHRAAYRYRPTRHRDALTSADELAHSDASA
jgi:hypothetical protein